VKFPQAVCKLVFTDFRDAIRLNKTLDDVRQYTTHINTQAYLLSLDDNSSPFYTAVDVSTFIGVVITTTRKCHTQQWLTTDWTEAAASAAAAMRISTRQ